MNTRTHLSLVPATEGGTPPPRPPTPTHGAHRRASGRPPGGRAAGLTALSAGLTLGLSAGALATVATHPGSLTMVLLPVAGAAGLTIAAAFRSRQVARRRLAAILRTGRRETRTRAIPPRSILINSRDEFRQVIVPTGSVALPLRRAA
ncbi:MAG: hypothetical protein EXQ74_02770 [Thermoleophilia bacterium]|nr:hypothetical protein [Thermoleophilia bacterium]